jgi:hypothetical protein
MRACGYRPKNTEIISTMLRRSRSPHCRKRYHSIVQAARPVPALPRASRR